MTVSGLKPNISKSGYSLSDEAVSALQRGDIQGLLDHHKARWASMVMEKDDDEDDDDSGNDDTGGSDDGDDDDNDDDGGSDSDDDGDDGDKDKTVSLAEFNALKKRMSKADQRADKAEKRLKDIDDADKSELQKAQDRVSELETENGTLRDDLQSERLSNAFLSANKHTWHKPASALRLAQSEGYLEDVIQDDGTVDEKALGSALTKLAKEHDYLVKPREGAGGSGESAGGRSGNNKDDKATKDSDRRRAPALARRGR